MNLNDIVALVEAQIANMELEDAQDFRGYSVQVDLL